MNEKKKDEKRKEEKKKNDCVLPRIRGERERSEGSGGSRVAIGGPLVLDVPSAARSVENRIPGDGRDDARSTSQGSTRDDRPSTIHEGRKLQFGKVVP